MNCKQTFKNHARIVNPLTDDANVILVRHAEGLHNHALHRASDPRFVERDVSLIDAPLTRRGHQQAKAVAASFRRARSHYGKKQEYHFLSSPLIRCRDTIQYILEHMEDPHKKILIDSRLKEFDDTSYFNLPAHANVASNAFAFEHEHEFQQRVCEWLQDQFEASLRNHTRRVVACTHYHVLTHIINLVTSSNCIAPKTPEPAGMIGLRFEP